MKKRVIGLAMAMVMCLSLSAPAFAAGSTSPAARLTEENSETFYLADGTRVMIAVLPSDSFPMTRAGSSFISTTRKSVTHTYNCVATDGTHCELWVRNEDENGALLKGVLEITGLGNKSIKNEKTIEPGQSIYLIADSTNGSGLTCTTTATISPVNADSVTYYYSVEQS